VHRVWCTQEIPLLHFKQKKKKIMTKKVGRLRNETVYVPGIHTHSAAHFMTNIPPGSLQASKHRCMLFFPLSSSHAIFFSFFQWVKHAGPRDRSPSALKVIGKKPIWGYNKIIKETPNNIAHSHGVGCCWVLGVVLALKNI
jgi:hypothetical protein